MNIEDYMEGKGFYFYGEETEIFLAKSEDELYKTYLEATDSKDDYPTGKVNIDLEDTLYLEEPLSKEDVIIENSYGHKSKIKHLIRLAAEEKWETPWQVCSSYL